MRRAMEIDEPERPAGILSCRMFISYAHEDAPLLEEFSAHLAMLRRKGVVLWDDREIVAGTDWLDAIQTNLKAANVILLLVSAHFLESNACYDVELQTAMERARRNEVMVIPIILRDCNWQEAPFARFEVLPKHGKAVTTWPDADEAWRHVASGICAAVDKLTNPSASADGRVLRPIYRDPETKALSEKLADAKQQRLALAGRNLPTTGIDGEIRELRRAMRRGGRLRPGDSLGDERYLLLNEIGRGGFASVWRAFDTVTGHEVAVKVLHSNLSGDDINRERFFRGARVMKELQHPAIVRITDERGEDDGYFYFAMEFVDGTDLREAVLLHRIKTADEGIEIILRIGDALEAAHSKNFVHRDVKPANVLLASNGLAYLADFDLVAGDHTTGETSTGMLGTFLYAAPELLERPQEAGPSADVYSLAMTTAFVLHGADLPKSAFRHLPEFLDRLPCNALVRSVLKQASREEPLERFRTAAPFCEALKSSWYTRGELFSRSQTRTADLSIGHPEHRPTIEYTTPGAPPSRRATAAESPPASRRSSRRLAGWGPTVFVSFAPEDRGFGWWIQSRLNSEYPGAQVEMSDGSMHMGEIPRATRVFILIVTPEALGSSKVEREWRTMHGGILRGQPGTIVPICFRGSGARDLPCALHGYRCVDCRDVDTRELGLRTAIATLAPYLTMPDDVAPLSHPVDTR